MTAKPHGAHLPSITYTYEAPLHTVRCDAPRCPGICQTNEPIIAHRWVATHSLYHAKRLILVEPSPSPEDACI